MSCNSDKVKLIDVMKVIPLYENPQSYLNYRQHPLQQSIKNGNLQKDKQQWAQIKDWVRQPEPPSEDIFLKMITKRLYDKRVYTGVAGKFSFVQTVLSQSNNDFREQLAEDIEIIMSSTDSQSLEANIKLLAKVVSIGKASDEVLKDAFLRLYNTKH